MLPASRRGFFTGPVRRFRWTIPPCVRILLQSGRALSGKCPMADIDSYIGKHVLAGLTYVDAAGDVVSKLQVHGVITRITEEGIFFDQANGEEFSLPPDLDSLEIAAPGR